MAFDGIDEVAVQSYGLPFFWAVSIFMTSIVSMWAALYLAIG